VREEWGKKRLYEINSHYDYGYSISRLPKAGDVLVFYSDNKLIGSIPVDTDARLTTEKDRKDHPYWVSDWKYVVGLDGAGKTIFRSPVRVEDIANNVIIFKGKQNLHAISRNAPRISVAEYNLILGLVNNG
jgi:hypothetical protein